jgi:hypothetical protein
VLTKLETYWGGTLPSLVLTGDCKVSDQEQANSAGRRVLYKPVWADTLLADLRLEIGRSAQNLNVRSWRLADVDAAGLEEPPCRIKRCARTPGFQWLVNRRLREFVSGWA